MGEQIQIKKEKGDIKSVDIEILDSGTIKCPTKGCSGIIFQNRTLGRTSSDRDVFGTCALCEHTVSLPKRVKNVKRNGRKNSIAKSIRLNIAAYMDHKKLQNAV